MIKNILRLVICSYIFSIVVYFNTLFTTKFLVDNLFFDNLIANSIFTKSIIFNFAQIILFSSVFLFSSTLFTNKHRFFFKGFSLCLSAFSIFITYSFFLQNKTFEDDRYFSNISKVENDNYKNSEEWKRYENDVNRYKHLEDEYKKEITLYYDKIQELYSSGYISKAKEFETKLLMSTSNLKSLKHPSPPVSNIVSPKIISDYYSILSKKLHLDREIILDVIFLSLSIMIEVFTIFLGHVILSTIFDFFKSKPKSLVDNVNTIDDLENKINDFEKMLKSNILKTNNSQDTNVSEPNSEGINMSTLDIQHNRQSEIFDYPNEITDSINKANENLSAKEEEIINFIKNNNKQNKKIDYVGFVKNLSGPNHELLTRESSKKYGLYPQLYTNLTVFLQAYIKCINKRNYIYLE